MSDFGDEEDRPRKRQRSRLLERGNEAKMRELFPRQSMDKEARKGLYAMLTVLFAGRSLRAEDDNIIQLHWGESVILTIDVSESDQIPLVKRVKEAWELCKYNEVIPERLVNFIESSRLNGEPQSCAMVILELLEIGSQFYLDIHVLTPMLTPKTKQQFSSYAMMSDSDLRMHLMVRFLAYRLFHYDGSEDRSKAMLDMVQLQKIGSMEDGWWSVFITSAMWTENWKSTFRSTFEDMER